jgi:hypothetical protein
MLHTRRSFIQSTAAATLAAPLILPARLRAADTAPSNLINMGFIGMGKQNQSLLGNFLWQAGQGARRVRRGHHPPRGRAGQKR